MTKAHLETNEFEVQGMTCEGCTQSVENALSELPGVSRCEVSLAKGKVRVLFDAARLTSKRIAERIQQLGYEAKMMG